MEKRKEREEDTEKEREKRKKRERKCYGSSKQNLLLKDSEEG